MPEVAKKEVKAYVHRSRVADVIAALKDCSEEQHYSLDLGDEVVNEYKLELLCEDIEVDQIVAALQSAAHTGQAVAGWITVTELASVIPIH